MNEAKEWLDVYGEIKGPIPRDWDGLRRADDVIRSLLVELKQAEAERDGANLRAKNFEREIREQIDGWPQDEIEEWIEKLANQPDKPMDAPSV